MTDEQRPKCTASEAKAALAKVRANMIDRKMYEKARAELAEARAQIAVLREALDGIDKYLGNPDLKDEAFWRDIARQTRLIARNALAATPSDCYEKIRAEVLEEAAAFVDANPLLTHMETAKKIRFDVMKDKP